MPVYLPSEEAAATVRDAESQPEELSRAYESVVADGASTFGTLALALDDTSIAAMLSPLIGVGGIGASERDERWIVVMEDVSAPETSESVIKRAGLPSGWTESVETDEHEADRRLCGTGGQLVWTNADAENSVDACAQLHSKPQQIRRTLNFYGRLWVCHAAGPPPQQPPLSSVARATRIIAWVVGGALSILLAIAAAHVVVECLTHKSREVEQSLMRAAEAAQTAHEETVSYAVSNENLQLATRTYSNAAPTVSSAMSCVIRSMSSAQQQNFCSMSSSRSAVEWRPALMRLQLSPPQRMSGRS